MGDRIVYLPFSLNLEELESTIRVVHIVHNGGTGLIHTLLKLLSVYLVVVTAWLAKCTSDELFILILKLVWSDHYSVD